MRQYFWIIALALLWTGCDTNRVVQAPAMETRQLDTMVITAPAMVPESAPVVEDYRLPFYNPSHPIVNNLVHTALRLKFDWEKEQVIGQATLTLQPHFYPTDEVVLDAKGFEFQRIGFADGDDLDYTYDGQLVTISLPTIVPKGQEYTLAIDYIATPRAGGGSAAISSDRGLFFINPQGEDPNKPQQIWTQGETEHNSRWFPTIDKPNQ
ncbi:MAG: alanyl aminopeptidase, partial [Bacteroidota bacterium]